MFWDNRGRAAAGFFRKLVLGTTVGIIWLFRLKSAPVASAKSLSRNDLWWRTLPSDVPEMVLSDDDLRFLESAPTTRSLWLFRHKITDEGLIQVSNLQSLVFLDLRRNTGITDAGLIHLEKLRNLKHLYLMGTGVTPAGAMKLQAKLPNTEIGY